MIKILVFMLFSATVFATAPLPPGATAKTASSGNISDNAVSCVMSAASSKKNFITGFQITASGATAAKVVNVTVTGVISGTLTYTFVFPQGVDVAAVPLIVMFDTPMAASAPNTAITVTLPASGAGGTHAAINIQGFDM